jgi:protein SCO1/2
VKTFLATLLLTASAIAGAAENPGLKAGTFDPPRMAPDFTVKGSDGKPLKLSQYRGKLVLLEFGYTSCVDVCPVSLAMLAQARKQLGAQAGELQVIYVTVDPERDTEERMRTYLRNFDPTFIGATGTRSKWPRCGRITASRRPGSRLRAAATWLATRPICTLSTAPASCAPCCPTAAPPTMWCMTSSYCC